MFTCRGRLILVLNKLMQFHFLLVIQLFQSNDFQHSQLVTPKISKNLQNLTLTLIIESSEYQRNMLFPDKYSGYPFLLWSSNISSCYIHSTEFIKCNAISHFLSPISSI